MKISGPEKGILALTLAFLLLCGGYFLVQRSGSEPYSVRTQTCDIWGTGGGEQAQGTVLAIEKVNINTATVEQLQTLPGIGQARAEAIVADREANGPYRLPEDITRVSGIGQGILEGILDYITVE